MMAQQLMTDALGNEFSDSPFFAGKVRPSVADIEQPTTAADMYPTAATGSLFLPGAGVADVLGQAPDPARPGQTLPSFGQNIAEGKFLDAGLQTAGAAGDVLLAMSPVLPPAAAVGTALKAPRAAKVGRAVDAAQADPNQAAGAAMDAAQARYFETGNFEPPTAENPVSIVPPKSDEPGIIAFHGSGADFDEFRLEMIGTGEGAQAYGYGLYFTDSEDIAKFYRNSVGGANVLKTAQNIKIKAPSGGTETAANFTGFRNKFAKFYGEDAALFADRYLGQFSIDPDAPKDVLIERAKVLMADIKEADKIPKNAEEIVSKITLPERGKMYKVGLAPKPDELLDYDKSLRQQPKFAEALKPLYEEYGVAETADIGTLFETIKNQRGISAESLSDRLSKAGIPGIKYRAAGSRSAATADEAAERNYVIFDDKAVKILEKYGIVGPVAVAAVAGTQRGDNDNEGSIFADAGGI
jgi:hypothetical protein